MSLLRLFRSASSQLALARVVALSLGLQAAFAAGSVQAVSPMVQRASDLGAVDPAQDITLTVFLNLHNQAAFDQAVDRLYDPQSPTYHQWLTAQDLSKFAPTAAELASVQQELQKHSLSVISVDPQGLSIRVHGSAANVAQAFQTQLHNVSINGQAIRAHIQDAQLTGSAGSLVASVSGLDQHAVKSLYKRVTNPRTGLANPPVALSKVLATGGLGKYITSNCVHPPTVATYDTPGSPLPVGVYFGNVYNPVDSSGNSLVCGFLPAELQTHYGLTPAYQAGLNGAGQTIVLLEAFGYPTMLQDANAFSALTGLPALNASTFQIVYPEGIPNPAAGALLGWDVEIALDIQWAHAMAPGAKIVVVATNGQDNEDFQASMIYIITNKLGTVVSDSWEADEELFSGPAEENSYNAILKIAAARGISFNFSSGDGGDDGFGSPLGSNEIPSNSPYATGVGGTAIFNNPNGSGMLEVGWGDGVTFIASGGVLDPPSPLGFLGGAGGGESQYYTKPAWQSKLPGTGRQSPDISALADPYTGVPLVVTQKGTQYLYVGVGGTSLASPIFSAIWAIATQKAGHPLGLAAPLIAGLPLGAVTDILPATSPTNLAGTVFDSNGPTYYSPSALLAPFLYTTQGFISADWPLVPGPEGVAVAFGFGIDSSLTVTKGWDNVTGFGVPNGLWFINAAGK